jgi:protein TonB
VKKKSHKYRFLPMILLGLFVTVLGVGAFALVRGFLQSAPGQPKQLVQEIHIIRPPPPPPDLPPPPPPPPEAKVNIPDPAQKPDPTPSHEPPPSAHLGLDAEGGAGGDAFGLVGNKGGRDLLGSGGSAFAWYAGLLKSEILDHLQEEKQARDGEYTITVRVWVASDGTIERVRIAQSSGSPVRDRAIEATLGHLSRLSQGPPTDMPQPISLRIVSRG